MAVKIVAPKVDAVELQQMFEAVNSLKSQLASVTAEASSAKEYYEKATRAKDGVLCLKLANREYKGVHAFKFSITWH